jgi:Concanavalin A-like lectin/glucanases superfamily
LGTEFGLNKEPDQPVKLEVFEGKVEVAPGGIRQSRILNAGEGVKVSARQMQPLSAAEWLEFLSVAELVQRESAELRTRYLTWRDADRSLDMDPATLVHLNFEDQRDIDRNLVNRAIGTKAGSSAMIFGCDWGEGRWPGKGALEFNSADDRVRVGVPGVFRSLTYLAWLRVDSLPNPWTALALVDTSKAGETHWQIHRDGRVEFSVRIESGKGAWERVVSQSVITRESFGKWIQLAAVYDGESRKMILYLNGQQVAARDLDRTQLLTLGTMELGNWAPKTQRVDAGYRVRNFHGRMDEFALLSRPLSAEEIYHLYKLGQPREATTVAGLSPIPSANP